MGCPLPSSWQSLSWPGVEVTVRAEIPGKGGGSRVTRCSAGLSGLLFCRKAITKSGLQHLAPPPPTPGALCSEPERQVRSTVDWSVSGRVLGGQDRWVPAPAGLGTTERLEVEGGAEGSCGRSPWAGQTCWGGHV